MTDSSVIPIVHDFSKLLQYAAEKKPALTPSQGLIPLKHVRAMMDGFMVKEPHEHIYGDTVFKKRDEMEYERFYFLDLLAVDGEFLKITGRNTLVKGPGWNIFFAVRPEERGFLLFHSFRYSFSMDGWLSRGPDFGEQLEENSEKIWQKMLPWASRETVEWQPWAEELLRSCALRWNSPDQSCAKDLATWALEYCLIKPLEYFGLVIADRNEGKFARLKSFRLKPAGCEYFGRMATKSGHFVATLPPFSLN
ncbi:MAG: hypothetical protein V1882_02790 [Candidatus Omnitrophota bacterium]